MQRLGYWQTVVGMVGLIVVGGWLAGCSKYQPLAGENQPVCDLSLQLAEQATAARSGMLAGREAGPQRAGSGKAEICGL